MMNDECNVYGVFDGATPLSSFLDEQGSNGAYLAANVFKDYFEQEFLVNTNVRDGIIQANKQLMKKMRSYHINRSDDKTGILICF